MATRRSLVVAVRSLLDGSYWQIARPIVEAVARNGSAGLLAQRLNELDAEARRLAALGERLTPDNPVAVALLRDFEATLAANDTLVTSAATALRERGIALAGATARQLTFPGFEVIQAAGVQWSRPDPEVLARFAGYAQSEDWQRLLKAGNLDTVNAVRSLFLQGLASNQGALETAKIVKAALVDLPAYRANALMRTLFVTSYREAAVAHRVANANILEYQVRMSALDNSCMGCVALHGTRLPLDARINDHWQGRCFSVTVIRGYDGPTITSGEAWFNGRSEAQQREQMGPALYEAWKAGDVRLADIPETFSDPLFGEMVKAASLKGLLGKGAEQYYAV